MRAAARTPATSPPSPLSSPGTASPWSATSSPGWWPAGGSPPRPAALDAGWLAAEPAVAQLVGSVPLVVGGRSAGARVACRTAAAVGAAAVLCLAFPLHPPGRPERSRVEELLTPQVPVLVVQGTRDPFGSADEVRAAADGARMLHVSPVEGADHGLKLARSAALGQDEALALVAAEALRFLRTAAARK
ncbi:alpha/beta family hydrolase [Kocuria sp. CPCC 205300]|uniref:alpha/beta hydrolase family protein n=1 Tax=Kocuria sabuli TaxID=3071448 RepID=UPI0036DC9722